jgi:glycosyltransferase involved in cell wall biosynthesis
MRNEGLPVYILIRTSGRPKFFANCIQSIKSQTYPHIITIVHTDDPADDYVTGDIIVRGEKNQGKGTAPYNLYNNALMKAIPDGPGYYCFIDDDDMYYNDTVIERMMQLAVPDKINVCHVERWSGTIWPAKWGNQRSFQTECFFLHTDHKDKATWWGNKGGDHHYTSQLTAQMQINWIDEIIMCKAQEGKGHGKRFDLGGRPNVPNLAKGPARPGSFCLQDVKVIFLKEIKTPSSLRGRIGDVKIMPRMRAERLERKGKVKIEELAQERNNE